MKALYFFRYVMIFNIFVILLFTSELYSQTCDCHEYIYLNDVSNYDGVNGFIHKFKVNPDGTMTEVPNGSTGTLPWFPVGGGLPSPHGLGQDLNGNLYIGESAGGDIRRLSCDGFLYPETGPTGYLVANGSGFNIGSTSDGILYTNPIFEDRITAYDICTGNLLGWVYLGSFPTGTRAWGMHVAADGTVYVTATDYPFSNNSEQKMVWKMNPTMSDLTSHTTISPFIDIDAAVASIGVTNTSIQIVGVTTDNAGNIYVVGWDSAPNPDRSYIFKFSPSGTLIDHTFEEDDANTIGFFGSFGIIYDKTLDRLYLSGLDDCVAIVSTDLNYVGTGIPHVPTSTPKAIAIATECCPIVPNITKDTILCNAANGDKLFLQSLVNCDGPICGGTWTADVGNTSVTFNACDNSIIIDDKNTACGTFTLVSNGGANSECGSFSIEVNISVASITAQVISGNQSVCAGVDPVPFTITTAASGTPTGNPISYQWQKSTTSTTTGYTNISGATNATYDSGPITQTTYFRVISSISGCNTSQCKDTSNVVTLTLQIAGCLPACCIGTNLFSNGSIESGSFTANASVVDPNNADYTAVYETDVTDWERNENTYWVEDGTRATDGTRFMYLPSPGLCFTRLFDLNNEVSTCKQYKICMDVAAFDHTQPNGGSQTSGIILEGKYFSSDFSVGEDIFVIEDFTDVSTSAPLTNPIPISSWNNITWRRVTATITLPPATVANPGWFKLYFSVASNLVVPSDEKGILLDNLCITEIPTTPITVTCSKVDNTNCATPNGSATATATGVTYLWSNGGTAATISGLNAGIYTVTVTSTTTSCTATCSVTLINNTANPTATCTPTANTNCATPNGQATVTTNATNPTFLWSTNATTATITGLSAGTYNVTVTNTANGCTNTCAAVVTTTTTPPSVTCSKVDNTNCATPNGSATATATGVTYLWSNGGTAATISGLNAGIYTVTVTSTTTSCTATCSVTLINNTANPTATCTPTANTNCATPNGQATVTTNATSPTFLWSTNATTATITGLSAGTYNVTVTNTANGCTNTCAAVVTTTTTPPSVTCGKVDNTNCATPNGSATATATGVTYLWSNGGTAATISGLNAGIYTVTVTSTTTSCTATCSVTLINNTANPTAACTPTANTNCATPNGQATVTTNATNPTFLWSTNATTATITGLSAGTYNVTVTNTANGCTNTCAAVVTTTTTPPSVTCSKVDNTNCATPNGSATATATGVTYLWSNGGAAATISGLSAGIYTVTVTSTTTSCTATCSVTLTNNTTNPTAACTPTANTNCSSPNGQATVTTNATNPTFLWSTNATTATITGLSAGTYNVTVTNTANGCTNTCAAVVTTTTTPPSVTCSKVDNTNCGTPNGSVTATATGVTYLWSNGGTAATISGLSAATYTVTVTNTTTGCTNTCQTIVANATVNPTCNITANTQPSCANLNGGSITVNPSPAGTYTYNWSDIGLGSANRTGLSGGTYTVTVTNTTTSCTGVCQITLTTPTNCCNINAIVPQNILCYDNGTPSLSTDNRIRFSANITNTNTSLTSYNVSINGGTTITPNTNVSYGLTQFTLGPGTAGGGATFIVTVSDTATPGCTQTFPVVDPGTCNPAEECPTPQCGSASIQTNGN